MSGFRYRVLESVEADIVAGDDGYYVYWPEGRGFLGADALRIIADELDRRNEEWHAQVVADLGAQREE